MKKMRKPLLSILLVFTMILSLAACGKKQQAVNPNSVTLTLMGKKSDLNKSYMTSIFDQYEKATGNKLDIISIEDADYENVASQRIADGEVPDIFLHFHNADLNRFDVENNFYYLNDEEWVSDLTDSAKAYCEDSEGNILGLPFWENSVSGCYYNKTILDSLGLKPATTQAEFDVLCQALAEAGYTPICWPANGCSWMFQFGLDPVFADDPELLEKLNNNEITYSEIPAVTDMIQWISNAAENGWFGSDYMDIGWDNISDTMGSGECVMTFIWDTWFYTDFDESNKYKIEDFSVMPVFLNTTENGTYEGGNLNMMMVNKNSGHLDEALEFLSFCATPENYNVAFDGISTVNCFKGQTTNIQSQMVTDAADSISKYERVSTAASRIIGYSAEDVASLINQLFQKQLDVPGCVQQMDELRIQEAETQGIGGF